MKQDGKTVVIAIVSSILSIITFNYFVGPQKVIIREADPKAQYAKYDYTDHLLSGKIQNNLHSAIPNDFTKAASKATPAVVNIKALSATDSYFWSSNTLASSTGSGVIISPSGYIVTNYHVIQEGTEYEVTLSDKREYQATLIGSDPTTDLALLKLDTKEKGFSYMLFGNSDSLMIGEWVLAVGNPFNLESTVTAGIVSAKGRSINILDDQYSIESFIQTDAAVNPGNSGGALVNTNGLLIGINTAIITKSGKFDGYSFAVPANLTQKVIRDLIDFGIVQRGILGVTISKVTKDIMEDEKLPSMHGVVITEVQKKGGAYDGGLQADDIIYKIDGKLIASVPKLQEIIGRYRPGDVIQMDYYRNGKLQRGKIMLKTKDNKSKLVIHDDVWQQIGCKMRELSSSEQKRHKGIVIVHEIYKNSIISSTNMDTGFIITKFNDQKVTSLKSLSKMLKNTTGKITLKGYYKDYPGDYFYQFVK